MEIGSVIQEIETGLSDFHKMAVTAMKTFFEKLQPRVVYYRD